MPIGTISDGARVAFRKLSRQGNSIMLGVPPEFLHAMNALVGDDVQLTFDHERHGFFAQLAKPRPIVTPEPSPATEVPHGA